MGLTPFQVYIQDGIATHQRINRILPELDGQEYYISVPSQEAEPLAFEGYQSRLILDHGDVIHLTPDPAPPHTVQDIQWSFAHFPEWSLTEFADGYDEPLGTTSILVLSGREAVLFETIAGEDDAELTRRICDEFGLNSGDTSIVRPSVPFERPMCYHHFLADIVYFLDRPLVDTEIVVFVDSRPVLQTFSAVRLRHPSIPVGEAIELFNIRVEAIEGYRLWLKGGSKRRDCLVAEHRETFWVKLEEQEFEYTSDDDSVDSDSSSDDDSSSDGNGQDEAPEADFVSAEVSPGPEVSQGMENSQSRGSNACGGADDATTHHDHACWALQTWQSVVKWNRAFKQDVFVQGRHGDTSDYTAVDSSARFTAASTFSDSLVRKRSFTFCGKAWLFGTTFLAQVDCLQAAWVCDISADSACSDIFLTDIPVWEGDIEDQCSFDSCLASSTRFQIGALVTLLEEAKDEGFDLVCQFVSGVLDASSSKGSTSVAPVQLSLDATIPCSPFQSAVLELQSLLPERRYIDFAAWQDWLDCDLQAVHGACRACPAIWDWLSSFGSWYDPFDPEAVHIYTDGSTCSAGSGTSASAAWAFNVWALEGTRQAYLGHSFGATVQEGSPFHLGESEKNALTSEQLALAWALCWTIEASCAFRHASFVFHFDNQTAGFGGFGSYKLPSDDKTFQPTRLSHSVAVLRHCAQVVCTVIGRHVPSHSGFAGNELADVLAKFASRHRESDEIIVRPFWPSLIAKHELSEWAWLALCQQQDLPALSAFETEAHRLFQETAARPFTFFASGPGQTEDRDPSQCCIGVQLCLCTLNVLSLREYDDLPQGLAVVGKRALLKQQFLHKQLHVVALQETRTQGDCMQPDADFVMLHSSCDSQGCFGCALWLNKTLPVVVAQQQVHYFTKDVCTALAAEPRLLVVQVDLPGFSVTFVSAHAPYDGHKSQGASDFWRDVESIASSRPSGAQLVVLADSNGHLGSVVSSAVGDAGAES